MPPPSESVAPDVVVFDLGGVLVDWNPRYLFRKLINDGARLDWFLANICNGDFYRRLDLERDSRAAIRDVQARHPDHAAGLTQSAHFILLVFRGHFGPDFVNPKFFCDDPRRSRIVSG